MSSVPDRRGGRSRRILLGISLAALFLAALAIADGAPPAADYLVLTTKSSRAVRELDVDLGSGSYAEMRSCDAPDLHGCCTVAWKSARRALSGEETRELRRLTIAADLFGGRANGAHLNLAYRVLEVRARSEVAILVTTANDSFAADGPRKKLLGELEAIEAGLRGASASTRP